MFGDRSEPLAGFPWTDEDNNARTEDGFYGEVLRSPRFPDWYGLVTATSPADLTMCEMQCETEHQARAFCDAALQFLRQATKVRGGIGADVTLAQSAACGGEDLTTGGASS